ncbi:hypothetical protein PINS_up001195 [Pythium insidiosum]|nr:hypothetical protein PINS_up001195 [Pythium insidiosum]
MNTPTMMVVALSAVVTVAMFALQMAMYGWVVTEYIVVAQEPPQLQVEHDAQRRNRSAVFQPLAALPVVLMHGMGDAAGNSGMTHIRDRVAKHLGAYAVNIAIGDSVEADTKNSFFMTMDDQLTVFAEQVRRDPKLAGGFNAVGFSQGNLLIRGYVERYNDPPVLNFISMHGPLAGVGALPQCKPTQFICKEINHLIGEAVYSDQVQSHLAQANYFRHPLKIAEYLAHAKFLPDINNERHPVNATYNANFMKLHNLVLVRAKRDTQVFPKDSEWFGAFRDGTYQDILGFNETRWYTEDLFGLQTLHKSGKIHFLETDGNHLQFSPEFLLRVVDKYFRPTL